MRHRGFGHLGFFILCSISHKYQQPPRLTLRPSQVFCPPHPAHRQPYLIFPNSLSNDYVRTAGMRIECEQKLYWARIPGRAQPWDLSRSGKTRKQTGNCYWSAPQDYTSSSTPPKVRNNTCSPRHKFRHIWIRTLDNRSRRLRRTRHPQWHGTRSLPGTGTRSEGERRAY
jgi:hypothetical protein